MSRSTSAVAAATLLLWSVAPCDAQVTTREGRLAEILRIDGHAETLTPIAPVGHPPSKVAVSERYVYVLQRQDAGVAVFDRLGERVGFLGGRGEGPGEFSSIVAVEALPSGDVWARDSRLSRTTWFEGVGDEAPVTRRVPRRVDVPSSFGLGLRSFSFPTLEYPLSDSIGIARLGQSVSEADALPDSLAHAAFVGVVRLDGSLLRILAAAPGEPPSLRRSDGSVVALPLVPRPEVDVAPDGSAIAWAFGPVEGPRAGDVQVRVVEVDGVERFATSIEVPIREVRPSDMEGWGDVPFPRNRPLIDGLVFGGDGSIWVGHAAHERERVFTVLDSAGEVFGKVVLAESEKLAAASLDEIWVIERDELDVESLVKHRVSW